MAERLFWMALSGLNAGCAGCLVFELATGAKTGIGYAAAVGLQVWISLALLLALILEVDRERRGSGR